MDTFEEHHTALVAGERDFADGELDEVATCKDGLQARSEGDRSVSRSVRPYRPDAELTQQFFAAVQNKMHWATHGQTVAEVIHAGADADQPFMGLQSIRRCAAPCA